MKTCKICGNEYTLQRIWGLDIPICDDCFFVPRKCAAVVRANEPCRNWAMAEEHFCGSHFRAGYGLFSLAVVAAKRKQKADK